MAAMDCHDDEDLRDRLSKQLKDKNVPKASFARFLKRKNVQTVKSRLKWAREFVQKGFLKVRPVTYEDIKLQYGPQAPDVWNTECYGRKSVRVQGLDKTCADFVLESLNSGGSRARGVQNFRAASSGLVLTVRAWPTSWMDDKREEILKKMGSGDLVPVPSSD